MDLLMKALGQVATSRASDLHITPGENPFIRINGVLQRLAGITFTEDDVKKIILGTSSPRAREILGKQRQVNYAWESGNEGRYRFSVFFDRGKFGIAIRVIPLTPPRFGDLGLPEAIKKALAKPSGLIIVGSPSGHGKTTTIAALLDFYNTHFEKNIITVENPVEIKFKDDRSTFIQRAIPLDVENFYFGLTEAYRLDPDVVVTDSLNYRDVLDEALFLCESGCTVIGATDGGSCSQIIERMIYSRDTAERDSLKGKLATHVSMVIGQKLVPKADNMSRCAAFDVLINTPQVKTLIRNENLVMMKTLQEQDHASGMLTFDRHLATMVQKTVITSQTAIAYADDPHEMAGRFARK